MTEEAKRLKLDPLLAEELGIDDPEDIFNIIIEYYRMPTGLNISSAQRIGISITGTSKTQPYVYARATKEQILQLERDPEIKMIWYSAPIKAFEIEKTLSIPAFEEPRKEVAIQLEDSTRIIKSIEANARGWTGKGVRIAMLDTGIRSTHPMLSGKVVAKFQTIGGDIEDDAGHGTHVASIAVGVAPDAKLINGKVLDYEGYGDLSTIMEGIERAVDFGANVISLSLGRGYDCGGSCPMCSMISSFAESRKIMFSIAAGNCGPSTCPCCPAVSKKSISVGATDKYDIVADFSSRGPSSKGTYPDACSPGVGIIAAYPPDTTKSMSGTSMATPHMAGLMALLRQKIARGLSKEELEIILQSCKRLDTIKNNNSGWGRIDCVAALGLIQEPTPPPSPPTPPIKAGIPVALGAFMLGSMAIGMTKEEVR